MWLYPFLFTQESDSEDDEDEETGATAEEDDSEGQESVSLVTLPVWLLCTPGFPQGPNGRGGARVRANGRGWG